jgi:RNA polymerase sigma-70 factor (ECF subfamily)
VHPHRRVAELYRAHGPLLRARCKRLLRDGAAAEDAAQDIFLKVLRHLDSAPVDEAVLPWLHRLTTNHCLNLLRERGRAATSAGVGPEPLAADLETALLARDFVAQVLDRSPAPLREAALLYHAQGLEQARVAAAQGVSRRTVNYRLADLTRRAHELHRLSETGEG